MQVKLAHCALRPWRTTDASALAKHANERAIWENLRDRFPHPYRIENAHDYLDLVCGEDPPHMLAIEVAGEAAGSLGFQLHTDIERVGAELGYWLGREHWGKGIVSEAIAAATPWAIETFGLERVWAVPFARNVASCRVLEKAGFVREGVLRRSAIKDGRVEDQVLFAFVPGAGDGAR